MAQVTISNEQDFRITVTYEVEGLDDRQLEDVTVKEIILAESLLTPGLQTAITLQSYIYTMPPKNLDLFKNKTIKLKMKRPIGNAQMDVSQIIYRLDNRKFLGTNVSNDEEYVLHACDQSLLNDAKSLVSKSWKCTSPSEIVKYVLTNCVGVPSDKLDVEQSNPSRDYIAENIHPFRVVVQQSEVALAGDDPSFVHYMTYEKQGMHKFRSLKTLTQASSKRTFNYADVGFANPNSIISFSFPTDFDLLSDALNGINESGQDKNTLSTINTTSKSASQLGNETNGCGIGGYNYKTAVTNKGTAQQQNSCDTEVEKYLLKRQARMGLIERDKIALRITTPWNPDLHAGDIITLVWNHPPPEDNVPVYGAGDYLIVNLMHRIGHGGVGITTMDCVSKTVGQGVV